MHKAQKELRKYATNKKAKSSALFFKTAPGDYGHGDKFIGVSVPHVRKVAKNYVTLNLKEINLLLQSAIHEDRLLGLIILTNQYLRSNHHPEQQKNIVSFYLKKKSRINNWDLVDTSAHKILGHHCFHKKDASMIQTLANSKRHWDRRMAIIATAYYIGKNELDLTYTLAKNMLSDQEDLMHKATGWMLREAGKRNRQRLQDFIAEYGKQMPRTMLRYAIEKFSATERQKILRKTK